MVNRGKRPILVAEKRVKRPAQAKKPPTKAKPPKAKPARPPRRVRNKKTSRRRIGGPARPVGPIRRFIFGFFGGIFRLIWKITSRSVLVGCLLLAAAVGYVYTTLPDVGELLDGRARGSVTFLDRKGEVFAWRGDQYGGAVTSDTVSKHLKHAVIATEDKRFYRHPGVDPRGVASAIKINMREGRGPLSGHGGSTITQQTAKLLCLGVKYDNKIWEKEEDYLADCRRTTLSRKMKEAIYALAMEVKYSKDEILSIYLNRAYMGGGAYGAEAASQRFFGKHAAELNVSEGAMIGGLLTAPSSLAPTSNIERAQNRANVVIGLLRDQGYITEEEAKDARANPAVLSKAAEAQAGGYFADWVMDSGPEFFTRDTTEDVIIQTTFDQRIQRAAETALQHVFTTKVSAASKAQAAIVVMSADGAVRGMVGGRKTKVSGAFNRAVQASRQTGSAFKPFVYATALDLGYSPNSTVQDEPYCLNIPGSGKWCPKNYTRNFKGTVTLTSALKQSLNVPAVKVSEAVGRDLVRTVAENFGIKSDLANGPALALGASEATLLETTGAYAGILNGGSAVAPYGLIEMRLARNTEPMIKSTSGIRERVISEKAAKQLIYMMNQVIETGTGQRAKIDGRPAAGKTGTTQAARDAWFIGFTADYVVGVWMGNDDNTPLKGVTGGGLPAEIWRETMVRVSKGLDVTPLPMEAPAPVVKTVDPPAAPPPPPPTQPAQPRSQQQEINRALEKARDKIFGADR